MPSIMAAMLLSALADAPATAQTLDVPRLPPLKLGLGPEFLQPPPTANQPSFLLTPPMERLNEDSWKKRASFLQTLAADMAATTVAIFNFRGSSYAASGSTFDLMTTRYKPWPEVVEIEERVRRNNPDGGPDVNVVERRRWFVFGYAEIGGRLLPQDPTLFYLAPEITDTAVFTVADLTLSFAGVRDPSARMMYLIGLVWTMVDFFTAMHGFDSRDNDVNHWSRTVLGENRLAIDVVGDVIILFGIYRIADQGYRLLMSYPYVPVDKRTWGIQGSVVPGGFAGQLWIRF